MSSVGVAVAEASGVAEARRRALSLAERLGFDEPLAGRLALVVTEAATNLVKHAGGGEVLLRPLSTNGDAGIEVLAIDRGRGLANVAAALRDGHSTAGSPGTGLGAIARLATAFDIHSVPGTGTVVVAELWARAPGRVAGGTLEVAGVTAPHPGETLCGDAWAVARRRDGGMLLVADGLGHGPDAHAAAHEAVRLFHESRQPEPAAVVESLHAGLRATRGAAVAVAGIDLGRSLVQYAGVGNIGGSILGRGGRRSLVSHNGIAGHEARRIAEFSYPFPAGALLVLHSDGLTSHWSLDPYPGLAERHPALVAGVLYRDFRRGRDDVTVLVARSARET
jgi:anti-sigma regulatory factor (Ser/Thr protein kinase)